MTFPLAEAFPGVRGLPREPICALPTPLEEFGVEADLSSLRVKCDDRTSGLYGGNKARKLEFLLGAALAESRRAVITFGAYGSNHALATAVHARALGLEPHVVLSPQGPGPFAARTLRAHAGLGTVIHPVEGWDGSREAVRVRRELTERDGIEPAVIPMGGTSALGAVSYVNAAYELVGQGPAPDVVYVAAGTVGTAIGLAIGFAALGSSTRVEAIRVTPAEVCNLSAAHELARATLDLLSDVAPEFPGLSPERLLFHLREDHYGPGYGVPTPETLEAVDVAREAGVALETTYTGKAFSALLSDAEAGALRGQDVVFWNTYNSSALPAPGPDDALPEVLSAYVSRCDELFGKKG